MVFTFIIITLLTLTVLGGRVGLQTPLPEQIGIALAEPLEFLTLFSGHVHVVTVGGVDKFAVSEHLPPFFELVGAGMGGGFEIY